MLFNWIDLAILGVLLFAPLGLILRLKLSSKKKPFQILEETFKLENIQDINQILNNHGACVIKIDRIQQNNNIVEVGVRISSNRDNLSRNSISVNQHYKFYQSYLDKRWDMAIVIASSLRTAWDGQLHTYYEKMIARCNHYKRNPPPTDWSGVYFKI